MLSGSILTRLGQTTTVALGFAQGASSLVARMSGSAEPAFLIASGSQGSLGFDHVTANGFAVGHAITPSLTITATAENGRVWERRNDNVDGFAIPLGRKAYAAFGVGMSRDAGPLRLTAGLSYLREDGTLLGARFSPAIGALAGRSVFLDASARFEAGAGWAFGASFRQGWTRTSRGDGARLTSNAWAVDAARAGLFSPADLFALRISQPLRVEIGGLFLNLPTAYDYDTAKASLGLVRLGLAPQGRQVDQEAVYSLPMGPGWLTSNLYWRRQGGNLAWFPDELGGAMRYSMNF